MAFNQQSGDNRLDILVLGPMSGPKDSATSTLIIGEALRSLLSVPRIAELLSLNRISKANCNIHLPHEWDETEIIKGILSRVDIADLVIVNLTPKSGPGGPPSPNVYYELGLVHSLGMPIILLYQEKTEIPFYMLTSRAYPVKEFTLEAVLESLQTPLEKFLNPDDGTDFTDNRITQFYEGLPIVDISAAVGLATGYYYNFVGRILREGSFVSLYPDKVKQLVIVRPRSVLHTYEEDQLFLEQVLTGAGITWKTEKLDAGPGDNRGPVWIYHADGIVFDLPRTIYPLKISPRLLSMQERLDKQERGQAGQKSRNELLRRTSGKLLDRVEQAILYHVRKEWESYRKNLLHFSDITEVPALMDRLRKESYRNSH